MKKIIRSICYFSKDPKGIPQELNRIEDKLKNNGYEIQTKRICSPQKNFTDLETAVNDPSFLLSIGGLKYERTLEKLENFFQAQNVSFYLDLNTESISKKHIEIFFEIIKNKPSHTFQFTYGFNLPPSSPYFPSAQYEKEGFSIGLQPTDLAMECSTLEGWFENMKRVWEEINDLLKSEKDFLGIDSSIAPLFKEDSSFIYFIKRLGLSFSESVISELYTKISWFIKNENPNPVGLCGIMIPCLEDFELAEEYERGNFSVERNLFLSLHSGLGIDTYPLGIDENPETIVRILKLVQALSNRYQKPLSVRFVSDGKAQIGQKTDFQNPYLKDITINNLLQNFS